MAQLDARSFQALLQGLTRRSFYDSESVESSVEALKELWGEGVEEENWRTDMESVDAILMGAAQNHWDVAKLDEVLRSMSPSLLSAESILVFCAFWGQEREKIHQVLVKRSTWNGHFKKLSWRVDVKTAGKSGADLTEPVALFELRTQDGQQVRAGAAAAAAGGRRQVQFEMGREEVADMLAELDKVQAAIVASTY